MLEHVVMTAERSVHNLSRASGVRLATNLQVSHFILFSYLCCMCVLTEVHIVRMKEWYVSAATTKGWLPEGSCRAECGKYKAM